VIELDQLDQLERAVQRALGSGDDAALNVLGYGEISLVLGWPAGRPRWACKRLPPFHSASDVEGFTATLTEYVTELEARGVHVVATAVQSVAMADGRTAVYCVQPALAVDELAVNIVTAGGAAAHQLLTAIVELVVDVVDDRLGLDAQLSNWAMTENGLTYFDVTTPLLRHADGSEALDTSIFLASLPWLLRAPVHRLVLPDLMDRYHQPRTVVLDLAANLIKERLDDHIATVLSVAEGQLDRPLTVEQVRADYRSDARTWAVLQSLRRADRVWQRRVRRRTYPFLLPARIDR
jgi:hypothetical protein